ncbi:glycoside hydrolase family 127 protein, partial [Algiphilus sp. NNCM1]|nr:glycoside hydrolase family 127 protein [Algiphilus acroporae]
AERLWLRSGSADYINFYERVLENHLLSTINPKQPGFVYFTPMRSQHYRAYSTPQECFWCCVGSGLENHARYGRLIYALQRPAAQDSADSAAAGFASSAAETGNTVSNNAEAEATRLLVNL